MEDEDKFRSYSSPITNGRITVTVAAAPPPPPHDSLTLALPIQHQKTPVSCSGGGGREDCWSEEATAVLIDAWGERYLQLSRGNLKQKHWKDVADVVCSSREDYGKLPKTDIQCKNRIDTVKKKYKTEKARIAAGGGPSKWRFYDKLDELIGSSAKISSASVTPQVDGSSLYRSLPMGIPVGVRSSGVAQQQLQQRPNLRVGKRVQPDSDEESEPENSAESSDGLPPESYKRPRIQKENVVMSNAAPMRQGMMNRKSGGASGTGNKESSSGDSMGELTQAILKFGEAYEQAETAKMQQLVDMEKQRMKFTKDLELQRMQFFMKMQMELSQLKRGNNSNHRGIINKNGVNNNNNSDSSN